MENADPATPLKPDECREPTLEDIVTLWRMKQTHRDKDIPDRIFLRRLLEAQGIQVEEVRAATQPGDLRGWLRRTFRSSE